MTQRGLWFQLEMLDSAPIVNPDSTAPRAVIIIPAYRAAGTIAETLESIQDQGEIIRRLDAVIVYDDASDDDTISVARAAWSGPVPLVVYRADRNGGEGAVISQAVKTLAADVEWFLLIHADDIAKPQWMTELWERMSVADSRVATICCSWDNWYPPARSVPGENATDPVRRIYGTDKTVRDTLRAGTWWHISGCAMRVSAYCEVGGRPPNLPQKGDWDLLLQFLCRGWDIEYVPRSLIQYRMHDQSVSSKSFLYHNDILESLTIVRRHSRALSIRAILAVHWNYELCLTRRLIGAILRQRWMRAWRATVVAMRTAFNVPLCLRGRLSSTTRSNTVPHA